MKLRRDIVYRLLLIAYIIPLFISCGNNASRCYDAYDSWMITSFVGNKSIPIDSIVVRGFNTNQVGDTLFLDKNSSLIKKFGFPLSLSVDSTGFVVKVNKKTHVFWIKHTKDIRLVSENCGFAPYYQLKGIRYSALIDSIKIFDDAVDPKSAERHVTNGQNITVYFNLSAN